MSGFWPTGLDLSDTATPKAILDAAKSEWETNSDGILTLVLQEAVSESNNPMIIVHAKHIPGNRTATLFSVVYRSNAPYPVAIQPKKEDLPSFLMKKRYHALDLGVAAVAAMQLQGKEIENKWVSDTPTEFREKLKAIFNQGDLKSVVIGLVTHSPAEETKTDEELGAQE